MAGMALQCVKDSGSHMQNAAGLDTALSKIKQKLLASRRADGHIGNEFSTGLAVQVRILSLSLSLSLFRDLYRAISLQLKCVYLMCSRPC